MLAEKQPVEVFYACKFTENDGPNTGIFDIFQNIFLQTISWRLRLLPDETKKVVA